MKRSLPFVIIGIVLVAAVVLFWIALGGGRQSRSASNSTPTPSMDVPPGAEPPHIRGNASATVTVEEFGDFQCGSCGYYYPELKKIEAEYGQRIRVIFRERPLVPPHEHALIAAEAAEAAGLQDHFWEMHDKLYEKQGEWTEAKDLIPVFNGYAKDLGLDVDRFQKDMNSDAATRRIFEDGRRAHSLGVNSTPTFFVNGKEAKDESWKPEGLRAMINEALKTVDNNNQQK